MGRPELAIQHLTKALHIEPLNIRARLRLAALLAQRNVIDAALFHYRQLLDQMPPELEEGRQLRVMIDLLERRRKADTDSGVDLPDARNRLSPDLHQENRGLASRLSGGLR